MDYDSEGGKRLKNVLYAVSGLIVFSALLVVGKSPLVAVVVFGVVWFLMAGSMLADEREPEFIDSALKASASSFAVLAVLLSLMIILEWVEKLD